MELASQELIRDRLRTFVEGGITTAVLTPIWPPERIGEVLEALAP